MNAPVLLLAAASANANEAELLYVIRQATPEAKVIIFCLIAFSIVAALPSVYEARRRRGRDDDYAD